MRLIDADNLIKELRKSTELLHGNTLVPANLLRTLIEKTPTAYDVDKVVEQLHKMQVYEFQGKLSDRRICHFSDVIEIVKAGGVNE